MPPASIRSFVPSLAGSLEPCCSSSACQLLSLLNLLSIGISVLRLLARPSSSLAIAAGLIVLMAQMGCYVPAEMAVIPVRDSLLSRIGTDDDMENNVSTFLMEMREVAQVGQIILWCVF